MKLSSSWVFGLVGAGGFGREVMPIVLDQLARNTGKNVEEHVCFVETNPLEASINGIPCISEVEFVGLASERRFFNVAVADSLGRQACVERLIHQGIEPLSLRAHSAEALASNDIGVGAVLCGNSLITANTRIGRFFHCNIYSYVAHDSVIGDFVTFAPSVRCNGNVHIGDHAYIGTGAIIKQGTREKPLSIGAGAIVGMGAVVTKDVPPNTTVIGNPARPMM